MLSSVLYFVSSLLRSKPTRHTRKIRLKPESEPAGKSTSLPSVQQPINLLIELLLRPHISHDMGPRPLSPLHPFDAGFSSHDRERPRPFRQLSITRISVSAATNHTLDLRFCQALPSKRRGTSTKSSGSCWHPYLQYSPANLSMSNLI